MREGWARRRLGDILGQVQRPVAVADLREVPYAGVRWYSEGVYHRDTVDASTVKTKTLNRIHAGDVVYNRMWATKSSFGVVGPDADGCLVTNDFPIFNVKPSEALAEYVGLLFLWEPFRQAASLSATGTTERRRLNEKQFVKIELPLPPLAEQRRIVDLVGALDDTIAAARHALSNSPYSVLLSSLEHRFDSVELKDVVSSAYAGGTPSRKDPTLFGGDLPWLKSGEVESDAIRGAAEHITEKGLKNSSARPVPPGATVVAMYGQGDTKGRAGFVEVPLTTNQAVLALIADPEAVTSRYLLHAVRSRTESLRSRAIGAAQPNLSKALVMTERIPVPASLSEQEEVAEALDCLRQGDQRTTETIDRLTHLRATMLTVLLSGEHEIPESYDELLAG